MKSMSLSSAKNHGLLAIGLDNVVSWYSSCGSNMSILHMAASDPILSLKEAVYVDHPWHDFGLIAQDWLWWWIMMIRVSVLGENKCHELEQWINMLDSITSTCHAIEHLDHHFLGIGFLVDGWQTRLDDAIDPVLLKVDCSGKSSWMYHCKVELSDVVKGVLAMLHNSSWAVAGYEDGLDRCARWKERVCLGLAHVLQSSLQCHGRLLDLIALSMSLLAPFVVLLASLIVVLW